MQHDKKQIIKFLNFHNFTDKELRLINDLIFYIYTEDYDLVKYSIEEYIELNNIIID